MRLLRAFLAGMVLLLGVVGHSARAQDTLVTTNTYTAFAGTRVYIDGTRAQPGSVIEAFDPDGVLCGRFVMTKPDTFGWLYVYGDDVTTEADDGASEGDLIDFTVDARPATVIGSTVWSFGAPGDTNIVELYVGGFPPILHGYFPVELSFLEDDSLVIDASGLFQDRDTDFSTLDWTVQSLSGADLTINSNKWNASPKLSFRSIKDAFGSVLAQVKVADERSYADSLLVSFFIVDRPDAPVITSLDSVAAVEDQVFVYQPAATDPDNDPLSFIFMDLSSWLAVEGETVTGVPLTDAYHGEFTVIATDNVYTDTAHVQVTVIPVNDAPDDFEQLVPSDGAEYTIDDFNGSQEVQFGWQVAGDEEGDAVSYGLMLAGSSGAGSLGLGLSSTSYVLTLRNLLDAFDLVGMPAGGTAQWSVFATDGVDTTWSSNAPFDFTLNVNLDVPVDNAALPARFEIRPNHPNPFNASTVIPLAIPKTSRVRVVVFDMLGRRRAILHDGILAAGVHRLLWDGTSSGVRLPSGVYVVRAIAGDRRISRKIMLLR